MADYIGRLEICEGDALDPLEHSVFQAVFGEIMTLLIALEFNHSLQYVVNRAQSIIQTKIVLLTTVEIVSVRLHPDEDAAGYETKDAATSISMGLGSLFFDFGGRWQHYRRTVEQLKTEGWSFLQLSGRYADMPTHAEARALALRG